MRMAWVTGAEADAGRRTALFNLLIVQGSAVAGSLRGCGAGEGLAAPRFPSTINHEPLTMNFRT